MADLKAVYAAVNEESALDTFAERWNKKYPKISQSWRDSWPNPSTYFKFPQEVRRLIYTTNLHKNNICLGIIGLCGIVKMTLQVHLF